MSESKQSVANPFQRWIFSCAVGAGSRILVLRDGLLGRLAPVAPACRHAIPSGGNRLDAALVAPAGAEHVLLICHGIGETPGHWPRAQALLAGQGIASLVFNYTGFGRSPGRVGADRCERDALAAYAWLRQRLPGLPVTLLGFSLGSGVATAIASRLDIEGLILCEAFTSFREAVGCLGLPRTWAPDIWRTERTLATCRLPVLIVHGDRDRLFPVAMAERLAAACGGRLALVPGMAHPDLHRHARATDWQIVVDWVKRTQPKG